MDAETRIAARLDMGPVRYWATCTVIAALALLLSYVAMTSANSMLTQTVLGVMALCIFAVLILFIKAGRQSLFLTNDGIFDSHGRAICTLEEIERVDRGSFAFKPSNGFLVRTKSRGTRAWHPGLWWRMGNLIGIGGITSNAQGKAMADLLALRLRGEDLF